MIVSVIGDGTSTITCGGFVTVYPNPGFTIVTESRTPLTAVAVAVAVVPTPTIPYFSLSTFWGLEILIETLPS